MYWKSNWLLASVVSPAFLLANASDALQKSLKRKAYVWSASVAQCDTDINQTAASISQFPAQSITLNNPPQSAQLNALIIKAKTNLSTDELKNAWLRL